MQGIVNENINNNMRSRNRTLIKRCSTSTILGTIQLDTLIEQDEIISKEINALNVTGAKISKNIIIVPVNNTLLYIEPVYQIMLNDKYQVPVLKKIIVASGNKVTIGNSFEEALSKLLSESAIDLEIVDIENIDELIDAIIKANNNLVDSEKSSDWEMIGKDITKLQELIKNLEKARNKEKQTTETKIPIIENLISE